MSNWISPDIRSNDLQNSFSQQCELAQSRKPDFFPSIRDDSELVIAGDYSGEHAESAFDVITLLLADRPGILDSWEAARCQIRESLLPDGRRHAYKRLSDSLRQKALIPFLRASSAINGILLCVAFDKSLSKTNIGISQHAESVLNPTVYSKLSKIASFGSILTSGLAREGQNLLWITDDDAIVSNERHQIETYGVIRQTLDAFCPFTMGDVNFGIASKFEDNRRAEDLCAIPDLIGGAIAASLTELGGPRAISRQTELTTSLNKHIATKNALITAWFSEPSQLKRMLCVVRPNENGTILMSFSTLTCRIAQQYDLKLWVPIDKGWKKVIRNNLT